MVRFRTIAALLAAFIFLFSAALAEEDLLQETEIPLDELLSPAEPVGDEPAPEEGAVVFTPSYGSPWTEDLGSSYWTTPMDITDEETVWNMLMEPINVIDLGSNKNTKSNTPIYQEPDKSSKIVGDLTNLSQGVRVLEHLESGWSHIECYSSTFASKPDSNLPGRTSDGPRPWNVLVSGYIETKYIRQVQPTTKLALVVDKLTQRLYVFSEGKMIAELLCSTGLPAVNKESRKPQPYNETRSGEFLLISKTGNLTSDRMICRFAIRFNAGDEIHEVPHVKNRDDTRNYKATEPDLGSKKSHGCIRVQRYKTPDGINMEWIWNQVTRKLVGKVKMVIWEDWQGRQLSYPPDDTVLYYNPNKGEYYHTGETCPYSTKSGITFSPFLYSQLDDDGFSKLKPCPWCVPVRRKADIDAINETYAPGGDHEEFLNEQRQAYYDYLAK